MQHILIVDDEPGIRSALRMCIDDRYDVEEVATGEEALARMEGHPFDAVLLDVVIKQSQLNTAQVLGLMHLRHPETRVIVVSAEDTKPAGAFGYITKDGNISPARVASEVERALAQA